MEASSAGKCGLGVQGRWNKYWAHLGCWISSRYGPFSLGGHFETYEPFISLIFHIHSCHGKLQIMNQQIRRHTCTFSTLQLFVCITDINQPITCNVSILKQTLLQKTHVRNLLISSHFNLNMLLTTTRLTSFPTNRSLTITVPIHDAFVVVYYCRVWFIAGENKRHWG
jgi:hypothetical protein